MAYDISNFKSRGAEIESWLQNEFSSIRTGQATPALLDSVTVESYGTRVPIQQIGSIGVEDARTLRVSVWDAGQIKEVEKAIIDADLGLSVVVDDRGLRVVFPDLTSERREDLVKVAKAKFEEARVRLRGARDDAIKKMEAEGQSEDETFRAKEEIQKQMDSCGAALQKIFETKESEIKG